MSSGYKVAKNLKPPNLGISSPNSTRQVLLLPPSEKTKHLYTSLSKNTMFTGVKSRDN